jgi:hypothetical protein
MKKKLEVISECEYEVLTLKLKDGVLKVKTKSTFVDYVIYKIMFDEQSIGNIEIKFNKKGFYGFEHVRSMYGKEFYYMNTFEFGCKQVALVMECWEITPSVCPAGTILVDRFNTDNRHNITTFYIDKETFGKFLIGDDYEEPKQEYKVKVFFDVLADSKEEAEALVYNKFSNIAGFQGIEIESEGV